ncbi:peptidoglycan DD-metalloendopeptidase family protein [Patescibacteria group bacterium]|nr:peptidoglycan DD-metalloendopeptidase family protein [Patescibacteria group bacterium]
MIRKILHILLSVILLFISIAPATPQAQNYGENSSVGASYNDLVNKLNENIRKQNELRQKILDAQNQANTLANQISYLENQIALTRLEIEETQDRLAQLKTDIKDVSGKLSNTKEELDYSQEVANSRIRQLYRQGFVQSTDVFLTSSSFNEYIVRRVYAQAIKEQDISLLEALKETKQEFTNQKNDLENKKAKEEDLNKKLEDKKGSLVSQDNNKQYLLGVTKNQEKNYQKLLAQVQTELESIARALGGGAVRLGPVKKGEVIAFQGNTGCSTGTHLHWGVYVNGVAVNPRIYINNGRLAWPEKGFTITQEFGANFTWYMQNFGLPGHNAIDMTSGFSSPIYASADGIAYAASDSQPCYAFTGTIGKGVIVDHGGGLKTIYWHIK